MERAENNRQRLAETDNDGDTLVECEVCGVELAMSQCVGCDNWEECLVEVMCEPCSSHDEELHVFFCPKCVLMGH